MPDKPVITISLPSGVRVPGQEVAGCLGLNVSLAEEKSIENIKLSLKGVLTTWITVASNNSSIKHTMRQSLFPDQTMVIWQPGMPLPLHTSGVVSIPFVFTLPNLHSLPPSFHGGTPNDGASVQYFIHAEGCRKQWYKFNIRVNAVFPFLPVDTSPAPDYPFPDWPYDWSIQIKEEKVRKGLFSHSGQVIAEVIFPKMEAIPLFRQIPIRIRIICRSKPLPSAAGNDPSTFEFPRIPQLSDIDLNLHLHSFIKSTKTTEKRKIKNNFGLQAGFGLPNKAIDRAVWGKEVVSNALPPSWYIDPANAEKGYWQEEITYSSIIVFRCPPPINTTYLSTHLILALIVHFPGLGNKVKMDMGPLNLTSGIKPSSWTTNQTLAPPGPMASGPSTTAIMPPPPLPLGDQDAVPAYEPPAPQYNLDLPPSYYSVIQIDDEKS